MIFLRPGLAPLLVSGSPSTGDGTQTGPHVLRDSMSLADFHLPGAKRG